ncbi:DUF2089 domain-containing protein [Clostridium hydrogeniformans]|uniref:DUF2089 domain-containing protein n=1 Tax=Clostridium hydrogeniformans TaxID=349933 RepID=UPI000480407B|nr:DUF2089 domain-containing protein [Clostridium hydrogeniformans]
MGYEVISKCPVCSKKLKITRLKCESCNTIIENDFHMSKFEYLTRDQLKFIEVFLKCRGNIKDVEKELKISYPTVRGKLDEVLVSLGYDKPKGENKDSLKVLDALEKGEITTEEAIKLLRE